MLIPLGTDRPLRRPTLVTIVLIAANVIVHVVMASMHAADPQRAASLMNDGSFRGLASPPHAYMTYAFLHGDWLHLLGNMLFLWVFGPPVEDRFGRLGFTAFFLASSAVAAVGQGVLNPGPMIGASGAVAAVTGAFLVMFPFTHVRVLSLLFVIGVFTLPSWVLIAISIARDMIGLGMPGDVAHFAHLGGYGFGAAVSLALLALRVLPREHYDLLSLFRQAHRRRQLREIAGSGRVEAGMDTSRVRSGRIGAHRAEGRSAGKEGSANELVSERARVASLVSGGRWPEALDAYALLLDRHRDNWPGTTLARGQQYDVANRLFLAGRHELAADAYERFIVGFPTDAEAGLARRLLARIRFEHLGQPERAVQTLRSLLAELPAGSVDRAQVEAELARMLSASSG